MFSFYIIRNKIIYYWLIALHCKLSALVSNELISEKNLKSYLNQMPFPFESLSEHIFLHRRLILTKTRLQLNFKVSISNNNNN